MTNTETYKSSKTIRTEWIAEIVNSLSSQSPIADYLFALARIRSEGPDLARPDFAAWQRKFRWVDKQLDRGRHIKVITLVVLSDLRLVNLHDGH